MKLFESDNIWKKKMREAKAAQNPPSAHDQWQRERNSNLLWLVGGLVVVALYAAGLVRGGIQPSLTSIAVVVIVSLYCLMTIRKLLQLKQQEPEDTPKKNKKKRK